MAKDLVKQDDFDFGIDVSDMMMMIMMIVMVSVISSMTATTAQAAQTAQTLQAQSYTGLTDSRVLLARSTLQWINLVSDPPYTPWITAAFYNDGPDSVFIAINNPAELTEVGSGGSITVDMAGGDRRIEFVFYRRNAGETASVRVVGKY